MKQLNLRIVQTPEDLQKAFCVRSIVFIEGQHCPYNVEVDGLDYSAVHFLGVIGDEPVATARIRLFKDYVKIEHYHMEKENN